MNQSKAPNVRQSANMGRLINDILRMSIVKRGLPSLSCSTENLRKAVAPKGKNPRTPPRAEQKIANLDRRVWNLAQPQRRAEYPSTSKDGDAAEESVRTERPEQSA